jgi:pimeloyl-ACP methyl ester carboxylesterase
MRRWRRALRRLARLPRRTRYARNGPLRIAYEIRGGWRWRRPWLVLVQGLGYDRAGWEPVLGPLGRHLRLVLIDNRGSGHSDPAGGRLTVTDMAGDVATVLGRLRLGPVNLMGVSLGGMIAQEVAIEYPQLVQALVLVATTPGWPNGYPMPAHTVALLASSARLPEEVAVRRNVENALSPRTVRERPAVVQELIEHRAEHRTDPLVWMAQMTAGARYSGNRRQSRITARTLVVHGSDDAVVDPRNAELLATRIPDARLVVMNGVGHLLFWEDPQEFADVVLRFLDEGSTERK